MYTHMRQLRIIICVLILSITRVFTVSVGRQPAVVVAYFIAILSSEKSINRHPNGGGVKSQQLDIFVLFSINDRIRLLSLKSECLKGLPFVFCGGGSFYYLSHVMRKPAFCICENKGADQLRDNHTADQHLCFRYIDIAILLLSKSDISSL